MLHARDLPAYVVNILAEADEPPSLEAAMSSGVVLRCWWVESHGVEHLYLLHLPWPQVLGIDSLDQADITGDR
jgi:hypothetical protein